MFVLKNTKTDKYLQIMQDDTTVLIEATTFHADKIKLAADIANKRKEAGLGDYKVVSLSSLNKRN